MRGLHVARCSIQNVESFERHVAYMYSTHRAVLVCPASPVVTHVILSVAWKQPEELSPSIALAVNHCCNPIVDRTASSLYLVTCILRLGKLGKCLEVIPGLIPVLHAWWRTGQPVFELGNWAYL